MTGRRSSRLTAALFGIFLALVIAKPSTIHAQQATQDWEAAAGGKASFEVASVKKVPSADSNTRPPHSNFPLDSGDDYAANGGLFSAANWPLYSYIGFAYKVSPNTLRNLMDSLPKWCISDRFDIEARAQGTPTKDQMRLMMQSLLADRFRLAAHSERRQVPVYNLVLAKVGQMGPQLAPHSDAYPCSGLTGPSANSQAQANGSVSAAIPPCGTMTGTFSTGKLHIDGRAMTMDQLASYLKSTGNLDRPALNQTNLTGLYDFRLEFSMASAFALQNGASAQSDDTAPTFLEALKEQLGLKLDATTGTVDYLIVDHVEEPSPN